MGYNYKGKKVIHNLLTGYTQPKSGDINKFYKLSTEIALPTTEY